ncbi:MAG TPA: aminopeptidase P family protein, partial [Miltoncostaea sp.]|nr:aminopeptidase P family protein [Miltoncostaea sp.]
MTPTARQEKLLAALEARGLGGLIVTDPANVRYLTGYVGSNGVALIGTGGRVLLTDSRYQVSATEQVQGAEVVIGKRDLLADVASRVGDVAAGGAIGVESDSLTLTRYERLRELLGGLATEPTRGIVEALRVIKDADEVDAMRRAATAVDQALETVLAQGIVGRTEAQVAFALHGAMLDAGATEPSFAT